MQLNDFLTELAVKYESLETLYLDIGTPDFQKDEESQSLFEKLLAVLNDHIQLVAQTKDTFTQETDQMWDDMQRMTRLMGQSDEANNKLVDTLTNMSLWDRRVTLQEEYKYIYEQYNQKLEEIRGLYRELAAYIPILGPAFVHPGPYPEEGAEVTFEVVQTFSDNIAECEKEQKLRIKRVEEEISLIKELWNELGLAAQDSFDVEVLLDERSRREKVLQEHQAEVTGLWEKLRIDKEERESFLAQHSGLDIECIRAYKDEVSRLEALRVQKMQDFIMLERNDIQDLWALLRYSDEQKENFAPFYNDNFTEKILTAHENEVARLKQEAEEAAYVLDAVTRYEQRLDAIRKFEKSIQDADRFSTKSDPGRFLKEEKERKQHARELPKVEAELIEALNRWQDEKGSPFMVYGEEYINTMKYQAQLAREGKENEKKERAERRNMALEKDLRYGSKNPKKIGLQSPNPRRISPSLIPPTENSGRRSPTLGSMSPMPQTPTSKRIGFPSRPGTPTSQHSRAIPSFMPTTPTRARSHTLQPVPPPSSISSFLQSPNSLQGLNLYKQSGQKFYSRSESPATGFSITKLPSTPNSKSSASRSLGATSTTTPLTFDHERNNKRNPSIISVASSTTEVMVEPSTPSRHSRTGQPTSYDLTGHGIDEDEEMYPQTPRHLKRTAAEMSPHTSPPGSPSLFHLRKNTRNVVPATSNHTARSNRPGFIEENSPFLDDGSSLKMQHGATRDYPTSEARIKPSRNPFVQNLLDITSEAAGIGSEDFAREASVIEMNRSEAEPFFSTPRKQVVVVDLVQGQDDGSEGWVTDTEESPHSRRQSNATSRENPDVPAADLAA
ncbi:hypothetical protein FBU30_009449 [Linnemannia zychae]|nr:hypothetical protein FBU30_009449 [Linnemannia zychae]